MKKSESNQQAEGDAAQQSSGAEPQGTGEQFEPQEPSQAELAVMHPDGDDPEWRYYFGAWHS